MFYRLLIEKDGVSKGFFHPDDKWGVPKEGGLYEIIPQYFESLGYVKEYSGPTVSWFTDEGYTNFKDGIKALSDFYYNYGINTQVITTNTLDSIVSQDEYQVWCSSNS
mgnify:CR=1 FL=1